MSNQTAITRTIIEALTARGFSEPEAWQMIRRVRHGDRIPDQKALDDAYRRGWSDALEERAKYTEGVTEQWQHYLMRRMYDQQNQYYYRDNIR